MKVGMDDDNVLEIHATAYFSDKSFFGEDMHWSDVTAQTKQGRLPIIEKLIDAGADKVVQKNQESIFKDLKLQLTALVKYLKDDREYTSYDVITKLTEDVLFSAFVCAKETILPKEQSLHDVDGLLAKSIDPIEDCLFHHANFFDVDDGPKYLILRSGVQFLIEHFKSCKLEKNPYLKRSVDFLDKRMETWKETYNSLAFFNNIIHSAEELNRPMGISESHTWWFDLN